MLLLAIWDAACLSSLYILVYRVRMGSWETLGNSVVLMPTLWVACSYLIGRYSQTEEELRSYWVSILRCAAVGAAISGLVIVHTWISGLDDTGTRLRGFIVPLFIAMTCISSVTARFAFWTRRNTAIESYILCSRDEREAMESLSEFSRVNKNIKFVHEAESERFLSEVKDEAVQIVIGKEILGCKDIKNTLLKLRSKGFRFLSLTEWCERRLHQVPPECVELAWLAIDEGFAIQPGRMSWRVKRLVDVAASIAIFAGTLPIQILTCLLIRLEDGGPIFYTQTRTGLYGRKVRIIKFRSMSVDSEVDGAVWSKAGDRRITRTGAMIRRFRIDELPQLVNVFNGDLSLIGPRPERPEIEESLRRVLKNYDVRYWIKPGLTGWAQVSYPYGASIEDSRQKLSYDLFYVKNAGILMDALIAMKTVKLLAFGKGSIAKQKSS